MGVVCRPSSGVHVYALSYYYNKKDSNHGEGLWVVFMLEVNEGLFGNSVSLFQCFWGGRRAHGLLHNSNKIKNSQLSGPQLDLAHHVGKYCNFPHQLQTMLDPGGVEGGTRVELGWN